MVGDLLGNQINVVTDLMPTRVPRVRKAGKYAGLAVTSTVRSTGCRMYRRCRRADFPASRRRRGTR